MITPNSNNISQCTNLENPSNGTKFKNYTIKIATLNIDTNLNLELNLNKIFPEYTVANRMNGILLKLDNLKQQGVDIVCIQEGRKCKERDISVNSVDPIMEHLANNNYTCEKVHYNNSGDKAFQYITALNTDKYDIVESKRILLSEDGEEYALKKTDAEIKQLSEEDKKAYYKELKHHYFDQPFPRSVFITEAVHKETGKKVFVANLHLGVFPESHKTKSIEFIIKQLKELQQQHPESIIFLAGDFNSFMDQGGKQQIELLHDTDFIELSKTIKHPDGNNFPSNSTFVAYPYDYAAYNNDSEVKEKLNKIKSDINKTNVTEEKSVIDSQLEDIRNEMISIFNDCRLKSANDATTKDTALYPLTGQLDHIFVANNHLISHCATTIQICDMNGNIIKNSNEAVVDHIKNSLETKKPSFPTDHQGLVSEISIEVEDRKE